MKRKLVVKWAPTLLAAFIAVVAARAALCAASSPALAQDKKPNVVFILADNVGYGGTSAPFGGGEVRGAPTPRIDQMAREGLRLTQYRSSLAAHHRAQP
jgi:hypothetical protein